MRANATTLTPWPVHLCSRDSETEWRSDVVKRSDPKGEAQGEPHAANAGARMPRLVRSEARRRCVAEPSKCDVTP